MAVYSIPFENVTTSAVAGTAETVAAVIVPAVAGSRVRILSVNVGPADATPQDQSFEVTLNRVDDVSAGGSGTAPTTIAAGSVPKFDSASAASPASGKTGLFTVEPTVYLTNRLWGSGLNNRAALIKEWVTNEAPVIGFDQLAGILITPRSANAVVVSGTIVFESF